MPETPVDDERPAVRETSCGEGRSADDTNAEGFVHVANGIHDRVGDSTAASDPDPAVHDWRGTVAEITITRTC